jgi:hypothetical protein
MGPSRPKAGPCSPVGPTVVRRANKISEGITSGRPARTGWNSARRRAPGWHFNERNDPCRSSSCQNQDHHWESNASAPEDTPSDRESWFGITQFRSISEVLPGEAPGFRHGLRDRERFPFAESPPSRSPTSGLSGKRIPGGTLLSTSVIVTLALATSKFDPSQDGSLRSLTAKRFDDRASELSRSPCFPVSELQQSRLSRPSLRRQD